MCDWCMTYAEQMQATVATLRQLKHEDSREPAESVLSALRAKKRA